MLRICPTDLSGDGVPRWKGIYPAASAAAIPPSPWRCTTTWVAVMVALSTVPRTSTGAPVFTALAGPPTV